MIGRLKKTANIVLMIMLCMGVLLTGCSINNSGDSASADSTLSTYGSAVTVTSQPTPCSGESSSVRQQSSEPPASSKTPVESSEQVKTDPPENVNPLSGTQNEGSEKVCYLTLDDGPSTLTPQFLEVFERFQVKVTYFVVGTGCTQYIKDIHDAGHAVALHTNSHQWSVYQNEETYYADLNAISDKVYNILGTRAKIIRFPGGSSNAISKKYNDTAGIMTRLTKSVQDKGYTYVDWNVSSGDADSKRVPAYKILSNIKSGVGSKQVICILMHDTSEKQTTLDALPSVIEYLISEGFCFKSLDEISPIFHHHLYN